MRKIKIIMDGKEVTAELIDRNPKTAGAIWNVLPIQSRINTWGDEIYFGTIVKMDEENAQEKVEVGDVAYWPEGNSICIFFGKTPASTNEKASESKIPRSFIAQLKHNFLCNKKPDYEWFWDEYLKMHRKHVCLYTGAVEALSWVKRNNFHLGMISDIDTDYLFDQLNALEIMNLFDSITTSEEAGFRKPDKKIFNTALEKAECTGNESIYIGDKIDRDVAGGKNVGMKTILFSNGSNSLNNSSDCPDFITDELNRIPGIVNGLMKGIKE